MQVGAIRHELRMALLIAGRKRLHSSLQEDRNVVLYDAGGKVVWASNTSAKGSGAKEQLMLVVSDAGVLVLLDGEEALWSSEPIQAADARELASAMAGSGASAY